MRIGVVTTSYPRHAGDPAGSFVATHVDAMRALGHDVDVIGAHTIASSLFSGTGAPDELERGRGYVSGAWFTARLTAEIRRRARDWDLVVAHWLVAALAARAALASLRSRTPLLAIGHGGDVHTLRRLHLLGPALGLLGDAKLVFVSEELRALARRPDALVQPMGIDVAHFASLGCAPTSPPTIVVAARLVPIKGVDIAIAAYRLLGARVQLVIAGDGPERVRLERDAHIAYAGDGPQRAGRERDAQIAYAGDGPQRVNRARDATANLTNAGDRPQRVNRARDATANVTNAGDGPHRANLASDALANITFLGRVTAVQRDELLRRASVVVVPSRVLANGRSEGMPMIALEALAAGVPVVASAVGGLASLQAATRVRPGDPLALAAAIDRVLASPPRSDELRASVAHLAWSDVARRLLAHAGCATGDTSCRRSA
ncbi:MAG TPA: glycosyltransferase family 4 protein [Kofleriaceae bacterium]